MKRLSLICICFMMAAYLKAQDIHFSQFNQSYLNLNPALTGNFDGDYRFNGNFRNQWSSVSEPFRTFSFSIEGKQLVEQLPKLNIGLLLFLDEAGVGGLQTTNAMLSLSYSFKLNSDSSLLLGVGAQGGLLARSINFNRFSFDEQYGRLQGFDPSRNNGEDFDRNSYSSFNLNTGFVVDYLLENRKSFSLGFSLFNLTKPNQSFNGSNIPLDMRSTLHLKADYYITEDMDIIPSILHSRQGEFRETLFGANLRYRLSESGYYRRNLYGGIWHRSVDAFILSAGLDYNQWQVGISYDINTSDLDVASNNRGGLEIAVTYIFRTFKPMIRRYKICPRFL